VLGLATAVYAYLTGSVQTDIKSALSFASLLQVGLIVAEIGLVASVAIPYFHYIPLVHLLGNACLRTLQFLRAPTLLHDYHLLESAIGEHLPRAPGPLGFTPGNFRTWLYRFSLERGYLDAMLNRYIVEPFVAVLSCCDRLERRWIAYLRGPATSDGDLARPHSRRIEDLP
jgi:NAD(P)H-quinone oxidoreductase subunit 5